MGTPVAAHSAAGVSNDGTSIPIGALTAATGDSVYVVVSEDDSASKITGVSDGVNTYTLKATLAEGGANGPLVTLWVADNVVAAGGTLSITVSFSPATTGGAVALDITGANPSGSYGGSGPGSEGGYASGTSESDSVSPSNAAALLLGLMGGMATATANPTFTYQTVAGETLVNNAIGLNSTVHRKCGIGVYSKAASGTGSQSVSGAFTFSGTAASATYAILAVYVLPKSGAGATNLLLMGMSRLFDAARRALLPSRRPRPALRLA